MTMAFFRGQEVVHVGFPAETWADWWYRARYPDYSDDLVIGTVYRVVNITPTGDLELVGVYAPEDENWRAGYNPQGFRPATRATSIEFAQEIRRKVEKRKQRERA